MVILSSTISVTVGIASLIIFLIILGILAIFIGLNVTQYKKYEKMTRYKDNPINTMYYKRLYNSLFYFGLIMVPLFKEVIIDARKYIAYYKRKDDIEYAISMWGGVDEKPQLIGVNRIIKMLKIKYSKKSFVKQKIFRIFVSK